jgi:hypothetical protein
MVCRSRTSERMNTAGKTFKRQLDRIYAWYTAGFFVFLLVLAGMEQLGMPASSFSWPPFCCTP